MLIFKMGLIEGDKGKLCVSLGFGSPQVPPMVTKELPR